MKTGYGGDVSLEVTGHGVRKEAANVVNEVGSEDFHKVLRGPGDCGRTWDAVMGCSSLGYFRRGSCTWFEDSSIAVRQK